MINEPLLDILAIEQRYMVMANNEKIIDAASSVGLSDIRFTPVFTISDL